MEQKFTTQGRVWTRRADTPSLKVTTRQSDEYTVCVTWSGPHILSDGMREIPVELSTVHDAGRRGVALSYIEKVTPPPSTLEEVLRDWGYALVSPKEGE